MTWATFYLVCFLVGVALSIVSFVSVGLHLPHVHLHLSLHHGSFSLTHAAGAQVAAGDSESQFGFFNFASLTAFLTWFGGTGYLLTRYSTMIAAAIVLTAVTAGMVGAAIIFWFVVKLLLKNDQQLDPADYDRVGAVGRITSPVRMGGTGEIVFSLAGTRQTCGARSDDNLALPRGTEVVITRYDRGIAYVRRWEEMSADNKPSTSSNRIM